MAYRVLIVEDDPMVLMINTQYVCKNPDFEVCGTCRNGEEALNFLQENQVDLILLDVYMPVMNGNETLKKIRERKIKAEVIMVTAANDTETIEDTFHLGVLDYLIKPFTFERFNVSLEKFKNKISIVHSSSVMDQASLDNIFHNKTEENLAVNNPEKLPGVEAESGREIQIPQKLPKGIQRKTLKLILSYFEKNTQWSTVEIISETLGISIVTVRNYLNFLESQKIIRQDINYGTGGRPGMLYKKL